MNVIDENQTVLKRWIENGLEGRWSAQGALDSDIVANEYLIDGLLPRRGTSVWFGAGSTGKTQLLLWMAAAVASDRDLVPDWLGHAVNGTGHVLILSAEDTESQILMRLGAIARDTLGLNEDDAQRMCSRLHVMPFISMSEEEFREPNAGIFEYDKGWVASPTMEAIREFIERWNQNASSPDSRIVGVVMDSATSMSGFEATVSDAVTNFFFYLNRMCEALNLFWVIIGHTPKVQKINPDDPDADAASRLRGVALWTTAPRTTVEVRQALGPRTLPQRQRNGRRKPPRHFEAKPVIDLELASTASDVVVIRVAKSNYFDAHRDKHFLVRTPNGGFRDVTQLLPDPEVIELQADEAIAESEACDREAELDLATEACWQFITELTNGGRPGEKISASKLYKSIKEQRPDIPGIDRITSPGTINGEARVGSATWHIAQLCERGKLEASGRAFKVSEAA